MANTCNRNAGVLVGTAGTLLRVAKILASASPEHRAFVSDCDQTYLNYCLNSTTVFEGVVFERTEAIYMNETVVPAETAILYHAIGMFDVYTTRTRHVLHNHFGFEFTEKVNLKRYGQYLGRWFRNEVACRLVPVGALLRHVLTLMSCA